MPTLTTDFNGILTGEQLGHIHGENERYRCQLWFAQGSLRKVPLSDIFSTGAIAIESTLGEFGSGQLQRMVASLMAPAAFSRSSTVSAMVAYPSCRLRMCSPWMLTPA